MFLVSTIQSFVESNGVVIGNVYTGFRKMHHDFGTFGVLFFQMLMAFLVTVYYEKLKNVNKINGISQYNENCWDYMISAALIMPENEVYVGYCIGG